MFKIKTITKSGQEAVIESESFIEDFNFSENMDNAILKLVGTLVTLYSRLSENKAMLKEAASKLTLTFTLRNPELSHLVDPVQMFNYLEMLDAQGYAFENATDDFAITTRETLKSMGDYSLVDTMALYWAKLDPELLKRCPRFKTDDKFQVLYDSAITNGVEEVRLISEIIERKDYDVKEAIKKHIKLSEADEKIVEYVADRWEEVRNKIKAEEKAKQKAEQASQ